MTPALEDVRALPRASMILLDATHDDAVSRRHAKASPLTHERQN
jgi:hypothetical protein